VRHDRGVEAVKAEARAASLNQGHSSSKVRGSGICRSRQGSDTQLVRITGAPSLDPGKVHWMMSSDARGVSGSDLAVARRAVAVALYMSVSFDETHPVRPRLPSYADLMRLLDVIGWTGTPDSDVALDPSEHQVLLDVVYATLALAFEEGLRSLGEVLATSPGIAELDEAVLVAAASLARLALRLQGNDAGDRSPDTPGAPDDLAEMTVSPALHALADSVGLPVWIADTDFRLEWVNASLETVLGTELRDVRGRSLYEWIGATDAAQIGQVLDAARSEHRNWSAEIGIGPTGGPYTRLLVIAAPRRDGMGALIGWTGICFDVSHNPTLPTRLEAVTQPVSVTGATINLLLRQLPAMIWTTDSDLRCTFSHGAAFQSLGAAPNQLVGRSVSEIVGTSDPDHPAVVAHRRALHGTTASYRDTFAGRAFDVTVEPMRDQQGAIFGCIGLGIEVTERLERERQVERLLRQLRFAQQIGGIGTWELDVTSGEWVWSDEAYRLLGAEPGAVEPSFETFIDRVHPDDRRELMERHAEAERTRTGYEMPYRLVRYDGEVRQMRGVVRFEHDDRGTLIRVAGILQDMTHLT